MKIKFQYIFIIVIFNICLSQKLLIPMDHIQTDHLKAYGIAFLNLKKSADYAKKIGLEVHAGHGLTYKSTYYMTKIKNISEFNIGHFLIAESLFISLSKSVRKFKKLIS